MHDLQLEAGFINGIHSSDDEDCKKYYGKEMRRHKKKVGNHLCLTANNPSVDTLMYLLGPKLTWEAWRAGMTNDSGSLVLLFVFDVSCAAGLDEDVPRLFTCCTLEYTITLRGDTLRGEAPSINTLEDTMNLWTVGTMSEAVVSSGFQPCNHGIVGPFQGARHLSFRNPMSYFFHSESSDLLELAYFPFTKFGYLRFYYSVLRMSKAKAAAVDKGLGEISERLQILPVVNTGKVL